MQNRTDTFLVFLCSKLDKLSILLCSMKREESLKNNLCQEKGKWTKMIEERKSINMNTNIVQNLILENRGKLSVSGVNDVLSFDDQVVIVDTELGLLTVKGENIRINKLSLDTAEVIIEGEISSLIYSQGKQEKSSGTLLSKIFK